MAAARPCPREAVSLTVCDMEQGCTSDFSDYTRKLKVRSRAVTCEKQCLQHKIQLDQSSRMVRSQDKRGIPESGRRHLGRQNAVTTPLSLAPPAPEELQKQR